MEKFFCENCGAPQDADAFFCAGCGSRLNPKEETPEIAAASSPAQFESTSIGVPNDTAHNHTPSAAQPESMASPQQAEPAPVSIPNDIPHSHASSVAQPEAMASPQQAAPVPASILNDTEEAAVPHPVINQPVSSGSPGVAAAILSVILSVLIFCNILSMVGIVAARRLMEETQIRKISDETDLSDLRVGNLLVFGGEEKADENATLAKWISVNLHPDARRKYNMTPDAVAEILEKSTVNTFARNKLLEAAAYLRGDSADAGITVDEIISLLKENAGIIYDATGYEFNDEDYDNFRASLKESDAFADTDKLSLAATGTNPLVWARIALSKYSMIILSIITIALTVAVIVLNRRRLRVALLYLGIPMLISGLIYTVYGIGAELFAQLTSGENGVDIRLAERVITSIRPLIVLSGLAALLIGSALIAAYAIVRVLAKRKALMQNIQAG